MTRTTVTTVTKEYDEDGRLVKETTTTSEHVWPDVSASPVVPYTPQPLPWTYPIITYGPNTTWTSAGNVTGSGFRVIDGGGDGEAVPA